MHQSLSNDAIYFHPIRFSFVSSSEIGISCRNAVACNFLCSPHIGVMSNVSAKCAKDTSESERKREREIVKNRIAHE